ncbi:MAG: rhodanese-like domain-containing protein [Caulobacterales bacterium]|nr:rhodanese-like domain-containing protein [Caulobacterales bacterium]
MRDMDPTEVLQGVTGQTMLLIDVREPHEFAAERIQGALNAPLSTFDPLTLPAATTLPVVLHCGTGKRSEKALALCAAAGVSVDRHLAGGLTSWKDAGLPTIQPAPSGESA